MTESAAEHFPPGADKEHLPRVALDLEGYARKYVWWQSGGGRCMKRGALLRLRFIATQAPHLEIRREAAQLGVELIENSFRLVEDIRTAALSDNETTTFDASRLLRRISPDVRRERGDGRKTLTHSTLSPAKGYRREPADLALYADFKRILGDSTDAEWVSMCKQAFAKDRNALLRELEASQRQGIEQAVRISCNEMAHFYYDYGYLDESLRYLQMIEPYGMQKAELLGWVLDILRIHLERSMTADSSVENRPRWRGFPARLPQTCFQSAENPTSMSPAKDALGIEFFRQPVHIEHLAHLAEKTLEEKDVTEAAALRAALGMIALNGGHYRRAAKYFLAVTTAFNASTFIDVVSSDDLAICAVLCALVTLSREEIRDWVLRNSAFRSLLTQCSMSKNLLCNFYHRQFRELLQNLNTLKNDLKIDLYMHKHVETLARLVHQRCYTAYVVPFSCVALARMKRDLFGTALRDTEACQNFEHNIEQLVRGGSIPGQLDPEMKFLYVTAGDEHARMIASTLDEVDACRTFIESEALQYAYSSSQDPGRTP
ncbi:hypothetical protein CCYA_CCYA12G3394 [Cyanidiococcus yangmingshanensis]|nr:hypothetical protein CCYA_CCYA12G3394 [Cyanidiococcus yangmingshanensis]